MKTQTNPFWPPFAPQILRESRDPVPKFIRRIAPPELKVLAEKKQSSAACIAMARLLAEHRRTEFWEKVVYGVLGAASLAGVGSALL
jgi:hypothetical protein